MIDWIIGGGIILIAVLIVVKKVKQMKKGESTCGCGCSSCPSKCREFKEN